MIYVHMTSMRPGQQWPRKPRHKLTAQDRSTYFNEAGATMAPETGSAHQLLLGAVLTSMRPGQQWPRKPRGAEDAAHGAPDFNEAGATMAPETLSGFM